MSLDYEIEEACGSIAYSVVDSLLNPAPAIVKLKAGDSIEVETKNYANTGTIKLFLRGKLVNYPDVSPLDIEFLVEIQQANSFVFIPPTPQPEE